MDERGTDQTMAPPGWFVDPNGTMRWWDGRSWTERTTPSAPVAFTNGTIATTTDSRTSGIHPLAIAALVCGFIPLLGFVAIVPGVIALKRINVTGRRGRIPAIIGITFGSLWLLDFILAVLSAAAKHS